jgi:ATP-dependent DNA helicase DinG
MDIITNPRVKDSLNFVAMDIETTGLDFDTDEIIELSAVRFTAGEISDRFTTLVKPHKSLPRFIELLTHITPKDLKDAPDIVSSLKKFFSFVGEDVLVGHNISFDLGFINHYSVLNGGFVLGGKAWDTAEISRVYLPYVSDHKLASLAKYFGISLENAHRAEADATATGMVLVALSEYIIKHFPLLTNARLLDLSKQAQLENSLYDFLHKILEYQRRFALTGKKLIPPDIARPNVVEHDVERPAKLSVEQVFREDGILSDLFPNFEFRSGQMEMSREVEFAFKEGKHLAVEAGTGVGKSFAYLVPAITFANQNKTKIVVSTNTKNLQEQLFYKDLPQLRDMLPLPFKASLVKGRENYICERRWEEFLLEQTKGITPYEAHGLLHLFIWKYLTKSGDVSENSSFDRNRFSMIWRKVCSDRFMCQGRKCIHASKCYVMSLRKHIETSSVVVTNHSLLLADLRMENTTLGEYQYLVVDEAHNLMSTAAKILGLEFSYTETINLLNQLAYTQKRRSTGFLTQLQHAMTRSVLTQSNKDHIDILCKNLTGQIDVIKQKMLDLFNMAANLTSVAQSYGKLRIKATDDYPGLYILFGELVTLWKEFMKQLQALSNVINSLNSKQVPNYDALSETITSLLMRASETESSILAIDNPNLDNFALWIESSFRPDSKTPNAFFCYAPIDVSSNLNTMLYETVPSIVFTSATLALRGSFKYFFGQSGLALVPEEHITTSIVESPFDYNTQSSLIVGSFLPEHKDKFFLSQALGCVEQIISATDVGTMILFTSYKDLNSVYNHLSDQLYRSKRPLFAQGKSLSRTSMLDEFKQHNNGVLLGTNSFWEGVDVQGESLSLLILFKLPFQVPSDPVVEALIDKLEREEKDSFMHFMLPNALLKLRQGFGRLIRSKTDRGVVLIMDSRVSNKGYGEYFKQVLPAKCMEIGNELELVTEISRFFNQS